MLHHKKVHINVILRTLGISMMSQVHLGTIKDTWDTNV
jgi:hypothetical protein